MISANVRGNRSCRHDQHMGVIPLPSGRTLVDAEAVLLFGDDKG
jgi:hypothetical protein